MKKAFDANVSRAKPRLRLGAMLGVTEETPTAQLEQPVAEAVSAAPVVAPVARAEQPDLAATVRARVERSQQTRPTASEAVQRALDGIAHEMVEQIAMNVAAEPAPSAVRSRPVAQPVLRGSIETRSVEPPAFEQPVARASTETRAAETAAFEQQAPAPVTATRATQTVDQQQTFAKVEAVMPTVREVVQTVAVQTVASFEAPPSVVEVQMPPAPSPFDAEELSPDARRERLKSRLKAVRENPRPEPMPPTVAETGIRAVERISVLQTEVTKLKALNLALTQDLEAARRTAEKATEEARSRMDEAQRLTKQMEDRAKLLSELERELSSLEGERDESLLKLQEARHSMDASAKERAELQSVIAKRDQALADSLSEEEKLAAELESAHEDASSLRRTLDAVNQERDTLARQVSELTSERAELLDARRALEAVHRALSQAAAR